MRQVRVMERKPRSFAPALERLHAAGRQVEPTEESFVVVQIGFSATGWPMA
jgi:hypothetical protein